jgi:hypothetical protein
MKSNLLRACWLTSPAPGNFGDILTPFILNHYGYSVQHVHWNNIQDADAICIGSIARIAVDGTRVLGSGIMGRNEKLCPKAQWIWVRGPLTRKTVLENGGSCPEIYGDAAMLLHRIYPRKLTAEHKIGIVPHHVDYQLVKDQYSDYPVINLIGDDPATVINKITKCQYIISSSLHGIITAHAYGIPAAWVKFSNKIKGDDSKFYDHYQAVGLKATLSSVENPVFQLGKYDDLKIHEILSLGDFV